MSSCCIDCKLIRNSCSVYGAICKSNDKITSNVAFLIEWRKTTAHNIHKKSDTDGGPPHTPPKYSELAAAATEVTEWELEYAEQQSDSDTVEPKQELLVL